MGSPPPLSQTTLTEAQAALNALPHGGLPEVDDQKVERIVGYLEQLPCPRSEMWNSRRCGRAIGISPASAAMAVTFLNFEPESIGCPAVRTAIQPYTDLLLHDMGPELADGFASHTANGQEWRTPPLWGLGLISVVNGHTRLLHDGRAHSIEEAIVWHGGEAEPSRDAFMALDANERAQLLRFLESL